MLYKDRYDAGQQLAKKLKKYINENPIIIALPRGGVVIGYEVARILRASLDIIAPRKIGAPFQPEFGVGAIAPNGIRLLNYESINRLGIPIFEIERTIKKETIEMDRRTNLYRKDLPPFDVKEKTVILVDDGIATGVSTKAAILSIKSMNPKKIILAVPICPPEASAKFQNEVDDFICIHQPYDFYAVGAYYNNFEQTTDEEVIDLIRKAKTKVK